jgi:hypothetical protein
MFNVYMHIGVIYIHIDVIYIYIYTHTSTLVIIIIKKKIKWWWVWYVLLFRPRLVCEMTIPLGKGIEADGMEWLFLIFSLVTTNIH